MNAVPHVINLLKKLVGPAVGFLLLALLLPSSHPSQAQEAPGKYFPQTGHYLDEPFQSVFEATGDLQIWGPPITEAFEDSGLLVQYFRRARMECPMEPGEQCQVRLAPLGELLGYHTPRTAPAPTSLIRDGLCEYYDETGHNVCFSFLSFYVDHGGSERLGLPISELTLEPGMITQYFRRARIEWDFDAPSGAPIKLGALGEEHFRAVGLDPALLTPVESENIVETAADATTVGDYVRVKDTGGLGLRLRSGPGRGYQAIEMLEDGTVLRIIGGPEVADGFTWWYLDHDGSLGWCADDWLERIEPPASP